MKPKRIAFANISAHKHQMVHVVPVAMALAKHSEVQVCFLTKNREEESFLERMAGYFGSPGLCFHRLQIPAWLRSLQGLLGLGVPPKLFLLVRNLALYRGYDAVVVPDRTTAFLKRIGLGRTRLVWIPHGAGDRSVILDPRLKYFDLTVLPGEKYSERLMEAGVVRREQQVVSGYPKFDLVKSLQNPIPDLFCNTRPTVLYTPHWDQRLSSWKLWGRRVLDYFAASSSYNLILAPHVRLYADGGISYQELAPYMELDNIHIDLDSERCVDMSYTAAADIYLGDVSSQVCEFVTRPRPAVFLNAHNIRWAEDMSYNFWHLGEVVEDPEMLEHALSQARAYQESVYAPRQRRYLEQTFFYPPEGPANRAAAAVQELLGLD